MDWAHTFKTIFQIRLSGHKLLNELLTIGGLDPDVSTTVERLGGLRTQLQKYVHTIGPLGPNVSTL